MDTGQAFITDAMTKLGVKLNRLLDLAEEFSDDDPFAALRLLQMCGVFRFGHDLSGVPPQTRAREFARDMNEAIATTFATIQKEAPSPRSTHTMPVEARGPGLTSLGRHASGNYIGVFFMIAGPLH